MIHDQKLSEIKSNFTETDRILYKTPEIKQASLEAAKIDFIANYKAKRDEAEKISQPKTVGEIGNKSVEKIAEIIK